MKNLITICARGGSKGIPGKNIKELNKKPLIYYTIRVAELFAERNPDTDIFLSTDSSEIEDKVNAISKKVYTNYKRPDYLATDSSGKIDAIKDVLNFAEKFTKKEYDFIIDLDVTSPLRTVEDLEKAKSKLKGNMDALNIFSVSPANRNPYFNMVEAKKNSEFVELSKKGEFLTRQSAPEVYDMNASFYIYRSNFFKEGYSTAITDKSLIYKMSHVCFDLDHPLDFYFMEFLIQNNHLDFEFVV
ncbi:acylneuraminate cytidylyltransferase family protein [Salegentibacter chungangensis]|uniref:Acylneuraminate cytidylyltransferase family protein n=1 Tax=Salegentibacter chungangensis TaxID=1335724 RepID=A0ABW3NT53_9FLAO